MDITSLWRKNHILKSSFEECCICLDDVTDLFKSIVKTPRGTPKEYVVACSGVPAELYSIRRNIFSTLFHSTYMLLDIPKDRRLVYGKVNYLFRVWVTSADNLLDDEDKQVVNIMMPQDSRVMRQVVSIMAADRVLTHIMRDACLAGRFSQEDARIMVDGTLQVLLPSAAQEASEESGIHERPIPEFILKTVHRLKTQMLFNVPLLGPERIEKRIDRRKLDWCREGLGRFGIGCQILDDVRDMSRDYLQKRNNYILSVMAHEHKTIFKAFQKMAQKFNLNDPVFGQFLPVVAPAVKLAYQELSEGLNLLNQAGLGLDKDISARVISFMFKMLDVEKALVCLDKL